MAEGRFQRGWPEPRPPERTRDSVVHQLEPVELPHRSLSCVGVPVPSPGTNGNLGRNMYRGPGFAETDLSLAKTFRILERLSCQIRFDAFNAFYRVNLGNPVSDLSNSNFGRSMSADAPGFPGQSSTRVLINTLVNSYETHRIHRASCRAHAGSAVSRINSGTHHRPTRRRGSQYQNCRGPG